MGHSASLENAWLLRNQWNGRSGREGNLLWFQTLHFRAKVKLCWTEIDVTKPL